MARSHAVAMMRRKRARRPQPALSVAELALYLDGDTDLAHRVLRALKIPGYKRPPLAPLDRVERWLRRQRRA